MWVVIWRHFEHTHSEMDKQNVASFLSRVEVSKTKYENWTLPLQHTLADFKHLSHLKVTDWAVKVISTPWLIIS
jgi:hypothetical protein